MIRKFMFLFVALTFVFGLTVSSGLAVDVDKLKYPDLNKLEVPEVEKITLDNGMRIYLLIDKSMPVFEGSARINCGAYLEPADKVGLASICGAVLRTGGTSKWTGDEIDEELEAIGGSVETYIGNTSAGANVNVLSEYTDLGLEVLAEILRRPVFDQDKIDLAKVQERSGISRRNDDPMQISLREYRKVIYGAESPFARHVEYKTINAVEREDLVVFHAKYFKPQNVQLAFWGDFDRDALIEKIRANFGDWVKDGDPVPPLPEVDYKFNNEVFYVNKDDVNQTNIVMGHIGGRTTDEDYPARIVMNNIFGGSFGSRMFNHVRSKEGLAYATFGVYTANISYPGVFYAFASTKSETTAKAIREIIHVIKDMQTNPPTEDEMKAGKDGYLNSFVFNFDSKREVVNRLMTYDFYGLPEDFIFQEKEKVEKVTPEDVITAAKENLRPDALNILVVGKGEDFEMPLDQLGLGNVTDVDITIPTGEEELELEVNDETLAKGKEILDKSVVAMGGVDAFNNIKTVKKSTTLILSMNGQEMPMQQESFVSFPDKSKSVVSIMGMTMYFIRDGNAGWQTNMATQQIEPMTEQQLMDNDEDKNKNTLRLLMATDDPYYKAVFSGTGNVGGTEVDLVVILDESGEKMCTFGFDKANNMLHSKTYWGQTPGGEGTIEEIISDYREVSGVKIPFNTLGTMDGQKVSEEKISEYLINAELPADAFAVPEG